MTSSDLTPLPIPVPPQLEEALGYEGDARWVAFYWSPAGDEAMYDDGRCSGDGDWTGYLAYVDHPAVAVHLVRPCWACGGRGTLTDLENEPCDFCDGAGLLPLRLGSSDFEADHWLVIDRQERTAYVAPVEVAASFLRQQWPPSSEMTAEEAEALFEAFRRAVERFHREWQPPAGEEIEALIRRRQETINEMVAWLDEAAEVIMELAPVHGLEATLELIKIDHRLVVGKGEKGNG